MTRRQRGSEGAPSRKLLLCDELFQPGASSEAQRSNRYSCGIEQCASSMTDCFTSRHPVPHVTGVRADFCAAGVRAYWSRTLARQGVSDWSTRHAMLPRGEQGYNACFSFIRLVQDASARSGLAKKCSCPCIRCKHIAKEIRMSCSGLEASLVIANHSSPGATA